MEYLRLNFTKACDENDVEYFRENLPKIKLDYRSPIRPDIQRSFAISITRNREEIFHLLMSRKDFGLDQRNIKLIFERSYFLEKVFTNYYEKIENNPLLLEHLPILCERRHFEKFKLIYKIPDNGYLNIDFDKILIKIFERGLEEHFKLLYDDNLYMGITTKHLHISLQRKNYKFTNFVIDKKFRKIDFTFGNNNYRVRNPDLRKRYMKYGNLMKASNYFFNVGTVICLSNCLNGCPEMINMIYETFNKVIKKQSGLCGKEFEKLVERRLEKPHKF